MRLRPWQWTAAGIASGAILLGLGINVRNDQIVRLDEVSCNSYNTLYNLISQQTASVELLQHIGFSEFQIKLLIEETDRIRAQQLETLGPRPVDCESREVQ